MWGANDPPVDRLTDFAPYNLNMTYVTPLGDHIGYDTPSVVASTPPLPSPNTSQYSAYVTPPLSSKTVTPIDMSYDSTMTPSAGSPISSTAVTAPPWGSINSLVSNLGSTAVNGLNTWTKFLAAKKKSPAAVATASGIKTEHVLMVGGVVALILLLRK